jgi:hypothetical protein
MNRPPRIIKIIMIAMLLGAIIIPSALIIAQSYDTSLNPDGDPEVTGCTTPPCPKSDPCVDYAKP